MSVSIIDNLKSARKYTRIWNYSKIILLITFLISMYPFSQEQRLICTAGFLILLYFLIYLEYSFIARIASSSDINEFKNADEIILFSSAGIGIFGRVVFVYLTEKNMIQYSLTKDNDLNLTRTPYKTIQAIKPAWIHEDGAYNPFGAVISTTDGEMLKVSVKGRKKFVQILQKQIK